MQAYLFISGKRRARELTELLNLETLAARGDPKAVQKQLKDWSQ